MAEEPATQKQCKKVRYSYPTGGLYARQDRPGPRHEQGSDAIGDVRVSAYEVSPPLDVGGGNAQLTEAEGSVQSDYHRTNL